MPLRLMYITNLPEVAKIAQRYGVDTIFIDLETLGKEERQRNMNTVKSDHSIVDIYKVRPVLDKAELMVRVNPWNKNSIEEIDEVIKAGADTVMLPMWKSVTEVEYFINAINKRAKVHLLLETKEAVECLDEVLKIKGIDRIHIGLNDLHLSYKQVFLFEPLANGLVEEICNKIKKTKIPYGFGGIASLGKGLIPAEQIILEHYRLGSTCAILSRSFCDVTKCEGLEEVERRFAKHVKLIRDYEKMCLYASPEILLNNKKTIEKTVRQIVMEKSY